MTHKVSLTARAVRDLEMIYDFFTLREGSPQADAILDRLEEAANSLKHLPGRGNCPPELERIGIRAFKEIHATPYRIIYQVNDSSVYIHCILDARRDIQSLLTERLLN